MTTYFVSRHTGAMVWAKNEAIKVDVQLEHLEINNLKAGDIVLGSLPVNLVAELNKMGVRYFHLSLPLPADLRGKEISAEMMRDLGARLDEFKVSQINGDKNA